MDVVGEPAADGEAVGGIGGEGIGGGPMASAMAVGLGGVESAPDRRGGDRGDLPLSSGLPRGEDSANRTPNAHPAPGGQKFRETEAGMIPASGFLAGDMLFGLNLLFDIHHPDAHAIDGDALHARLGGLFDRIGDGIGLGHFWGGMEKRASNEPKRKTGQRKESALHWPVLEFRIVLVLTHHKAATYLDTYIRAAGIAADSKDSLFRTAAGKLGHLTQNPMS